MVISEQTIQKLKSEFVIGFYDNNVNEMPPHLATHLSIHAMADYSELLFKTLKTPTKKEVTMEWVMEKLGADKVYTDFAPKFGAYLKTIGVSGMNTYPASYGIGVWAAMTYKNTHSEDRDAIEKALTNLGVEFTSEYSDAHWVFRYKISKSKQNIEKINKFLQQCHF